MGWVVGRDRWWGRAGAKRSDRDVAGYAWLVIDYLEGQGGRSRATNVLDRAVQLGLDATEPRLALLHAQSLLDRDRLDAVEPVVTACARPAGNTTTATWAAGPYAEALARARPGRAVDRSLARRARPEGRVRPNRFKR